jgi:drug/metabolite transporter (DMT)-like permease
LSPTAQPAPQRRASGDAVLFVLTAFWGLTFVMVKAALAHVDPVTFLVLRFSLGAAAVTLVAGRSLKDRDTLRAGLLLGVFLFLAFITQTAGLVYTTPSRSAFLTGMNVLLVPFTTLALFRRVPRPTSLLGVALAVVGLYVLTGGLSNEDGATWRGDLLTLACAATYAVHITLTEYFAPRVKIAALVATQLWTVAALSLCALPFVTVRFEPSPALWGDIAFCGLVMSAAAIFVQTWGQARTTAVRAALIYSLEPVFAAGYSVAAGEETLGRREWIGGALIIGAVVLAEAGGALWARWRERETGS